MPYDKKMIKVKHDYYAQIRAKAVQTMVAMGAKPASRDMELNSWEGMMSLFAYVKSHKPTTEEMIAAECAWRRWNTADIECGKYEAMLAAWEEPAQK